MLDPPGTAIMAFMAFADGEVIQGRTVFLSGLARMLPAHSTTVASRTAAYRAKGRIAARRWLRVCTEQPRFLFQVVEKGCHAVDGQVFDLRALHWLAAAPGHERLQQRQAVAMTFPGIDGQIALYREMLHE